MGVILSVNAISNYSYVYSTTYDTTEQYKLFKSVISNAQIDELCRKYGIVQTGDSATDLKALYQAMYKDAQTEVIGSTASAASEQTQQQAVQQTSQKQTLDSTQVPWGILMSQIGVAATGDFSTDYQAFQNRIMAMQLNAQTPQEKANISQLQAEASIVFIQPEATTTQVGPAAQHLTQPARQSTPSGADITAQLNKMYFLSSRA